MADLTLKKGGAGGFNFQLKQKNPDGTPGTPIDISNWTFRAHLRVTPKSPIVAAELISHGGILITDGPNGRGRVLFLPEVTKRLPAGSYVFDLFRETPLPRQPIPVDTRTIDLQEAITR